MDNFHGSYSEDKKNKGISADSRQKTIENAKITIERSLKYVIWMLLFLFSFNISGKKWYQRKPVETCHFVMEIVTKTIDVIVLSLFIEIFIVFIIVLPCYEIFK